MTALTAVGAFVELHADHFEDDISDEGWLPVVGAKRWVGLSNDKRIRHRRIERQALLAAGIRAIVLTVAHPLAASLFASPQSGSRASIFASLRA